MKKPALNRNSSIELLRILAACGVILLHYNNASIGGGMKYVQDNSINEWYLHLIQAIFCTSVNIFILISGYFQSGKKISSRKILDLFTLTLFTRLLFYFIQIGIGTISYTAKGLIIAVLPTNYFLVLYVTLYILTPFLNLFSEKLSHCQFKKFVQVLFWLFSVFAFCVDCLEKLLGDSVTSMSPVGMCGSQYGSTIVNFILVYFIGAYLRIAKIKMDRNSTLLRSFGCLGIIMVLSIFGARAWYYDNPFVILLSVFIFALFKSVEFKSSLINTFAQGTFACYLAHGYFIEFLNIEFYVNEKLPVLVLHQIIICIILYMLSYLIYMLYSITVGALVNKISDDNLLSKIIQQYTSME